MTEQRFNQLIEEFRQWNFEITAYFIVGWLLFCILCVLLPWLADKYEERKYKGDLND